MGKRVWDIVAVSVLLVPAFPILALAALAVAVFDGRPVLFGHWRVGRDGRPFRCWKFRTMIVGAEQLDQALRGRYQRKGFKLPTRSDRRVTSVGRLLRRTYVDELPQLLNVLVGDMSLVGPRPVPKDELFEFGSNAEELLDVTPGIFGAWNSLGHARPPYPERAEIEMAYLRDQNPTKDLAILLRSVRSVFQGEPEE